MMARSRSSPRARSLSEWIRALAGGLWNAVPPVRRPQVRRFLLTVGRSDDTEMDPQVYERRMRREIAHYERIFRGRMKEETPPIWTEVERRFEDAIEAKIGVRSLYHYVARHVRGKSHVSVLGLGSGACGPELEGIAPMLREQQCGMDLMCIDINPTIMEQARLEARKRGVSFRGLVADVNTLTLDPERYDVIVAYAALHHFVALDRIAREINRGLRPDGIFVTVDIPTRNGYRMWDETHTIVTALWKVLPAKYKIAHTGYPTPTYVETYENEDYSRDSFECINSEAILPALRHHLHEVAFVPALCIARRFFDTKFGPNYDLDDALDRAIFEFIMRLDGYYIETGALKPETFFGAYARKQP